jgi:hypothetical protein
MRITTLLPSTGFERPSADERRELLRIVRAEHELPAISESEFARAFWAVGYQYRLAEPDASLNFYTHIGHCNDFLSQYRYGEIDGSAVLAAVISHGDIPWRAANPGKGALLEVGMNPYSGIKCSNAWRRVLQGEPLLEPLGPRGVTRAPSDSLPRPKFYEADSQGRMVEFDPSKPAWAR